MLSVFNHRQFLANMLKNNLIEMQKTSTAKQLLVDNQNAIIINRLLTPSDIFVTGLKITKIRDVKSDLTNKNILILINLNEQVLKDIQKICKLQNLYIILNNITTKSESQLIKQWNLKKNIKALRQINIDFIPFINNVYQINPFMSTKLTTHKLTSFLLSFQKFYQFEIQYPKSLASLGNEIKQTLLQKLTILQKHKCPQYKQSKQRIKMLIIDRNVDLLSPLILSFYFGCAAYQMKLQELMERYLGNKVFNELFDLDFMQAHQYLKGITDEKDNYRKKDFDLKDPMAAKQIISKNYNPEIDNAELKSYLEIFQQVMKYCQNRQQQCVLEHSLVNGINEQGIQLNNNSVIKEVLKWIESKEKCDQNQCSKIILLVMVIYDLWFYHRSQLMSLIPKKQHQKIYKMMEKFPKKKHAKLVEKPQSEQKRMDFYRHEPTFIKLLNKWFENTNDLLPQYDRLVINKTFLVSQPKNIIYINGQLGYNELSFLKKVLNTKQTNSRTFIICNKLVTIRQYFQTLQRA